MCDDEGRGHLGRYLCNLLISGRFRQSGGVSQIQVAD